MVPNRAPWVQTASAHPVTIRSISLGPGVGREVEVVLLDAARPTCCTRASLTEPPTRYSRLPARSNRPASSEVASTRCRNRWGTVDCTRPR